MSKPAIEVRNLTVGYDGLAVARDLCLRVDAQKILAVLGPNGAGKTSLLMTLAGFLPAIDGEVIVEGRSLASGSPLRANRAGVVLVPDSRALFTQLTPVDNLRLAAGRGGSIDDVLDLFPALTARSDVPAGALSGGEQQMLAVARALVQRPRVLLIDEMSMGLAPVVVESLMPIVRRVADETGAGIVLVEQHVDLALGVADHATVLVHGDTTLTGTAADVREDPDGLEAAYLGRSTSTA